MRILAQELMHFHCKLMHDHKFVSVQNNYKYSLLLIREKEIRGHP